MLFRPQIPYLLEWIVFYQMQGAALMDSVPSIGPALWNLPLCC